VNKERLVEDNMNLVYYIINQYYPTYLHNEDVVQQGMLGLVKAADAWDESKSKFSTYASKCILNEIRLWFRSECKHIDVQSLDYEISTDDGEFATVADLIACDDGMDYDLFHSYLLFQRTLTDQEKEIIRLKLEDFTQTEIAEMLGCSRPNICRIIKKIGMKWRRFNGNNKD
jgi:RNA polymerase sporulation-specific sigma factor